MSSEFFVHSQKPMDIWSLREKLALACSVMRSGDQNWASVSRTLYPFGKLDNPAEWFSQKNCALQYKALLETVGTTKRKRGENDTAGDLIVQQLVTERITELQTIIQTNRDRYKLLKQNVAELKAGLHDNTLIDIWEEMTNEEKDAKADVKIEIKEEVDSENVKEDIVYEEIMVEEVADTIVETEIKTERYCNTPEPCNEVTLVTDADSSSNNDLIDSVELEIKIEDKVDIITHEEPQTVIEDVHVFHDDIVNEETVCIETNTDVVETTIYIKEEILDVNNSEMVNEELVHSSVKIENQENSCNIDDKDESIIFIVEDESIKENNTADELMPSNIVNNDVLDESSCDNSSQNISDDIETNIIKSPSQPIEENVASDIIEDTFIPLKDDSLLSNNEDTKVDDDSNFDADNTISPKIKLSSPRIKTSPKILSPISKTEVKEHRTGKLIPEPELKAMEQGIRIPIPIDDDDIDDDDDEDDEDIYDHADDHADEEEEDDDDIDEEIKCIERDILSEEEKIDKSDNEENVEQIKSVSSATDEDNVLSPVSSIETDPEIVRGKCVKAAMKMASNPSIEILQKTDIESSDDENTKYDRYSDSLALTPRPHVGFSESVPSSPMSVGHSDTEDEKSHKIWKKSIMLVWRSAANHKYANLFLHPVTDAIAPGYSAVVNRPLDLGSIKRNIENGVIKTTAEFQRDMMLMFTNARMYNSSDHNVYKMTLEMYNDVMFHIEQYINTQIMVNGTPKMLRPSRRSEVSCEREDDVKKRKIVDQEGGKVKKRKL